MSVTRIENVTVWTGERLPDGRVIQSDAVAFADGVVVALGDAARGMNASDVIDARGGFVCAAFGDGHVHPVFGGLEQQFADVRAKADPQAIARSVGEWARTHPDAEWVRGEGFDHTLAPGGVFLATWLDAEVPDRPVFLRATDYHTVWVNSEALRRVGYSSSTPQPHDGEIVMGDDGEPTGTLREWGAWRPVYSLMPPVSAEMARAALAYASSSFASAGITWVQDAWVEPADIEIWLDALDAGVVDVRADLGLWADPNTWRSQLAAMERARTLVEDRGIRDGRRMLTASTVKFFADGVVESATAALLEPYCDCPHSMGMPNWDAAELAAAVVAVDALGFTPHIHAIGDGAVRMALDAIEHAMTVNGRRDSRPTVAHTQLVDDADVARFAELGVIANFEPYWAKYDEWQTELSAPRLGPDRTDRQYMIRTILNTGARVSFGSDWPVTTYAPLDGIAVAVHRSMPGGSPWMPEERITVEEALAAYTSGVAFQAKDAVAGIVRPGARADLVLLANDPRTVDPRAIADIAVLGTWCDGYRIHG